MTSNVLTPNKKMINIELTPVMYDQLKELVKNKRISSMRSFCSEAIEKMLLELEEKQNHQIMIEAMNDPGFLERCEEVQRDFAAIDYPGGPSEW